ncbi:hypothetical protein llap_18407 [Limosa lapponica baueri]|uniref:Cytosolic iron-sulfur assembly component 2A n=1 Tax=Limosa lapponica baueri TaxID=1758121 RepID=A0A2I0TBU8_LIMLA|nr:hypothetical protein llap_18407 [Limosa lapponica baueri]
MILKESYFIDGHWSSALDIIRTIRDPEKPNTLEELEVVTESCVEVQEIGEDEYLVIIRFTPTVPHCSLATLIGLCLRIKLQRCLPFRHKSGVGRGFAVSPPQPQGLGVTVPVEPYRVWQRASEQIMVATDEWRNRSRRVVSGRGLGA